MKKVELLFMDGYDEVVNPKTNEVVFKTETIENIDVIDNVVLIWNEKKTVNDNLFSGGAVDTYLLNEGRCSQEEREFIVESIFAYANKDGSIR